MAHRRQVSSLNLTRNVPPRPSSPAHNWWIGRNKGQKKCEDCRPQRSRRRMTFFFYPSTPCGNRHWLLSGDMRSVVIMARAVCEHCKREYLIADDVPMTEKKRPRSVSHRRSSCQLDGIGIKAPSLERFRAWRRAGLFLRVGCYVCTLCLPVKNSFLLCKFRVRVRWTLR